MKLKCSEKKLVGNKMYFDLLKPLRSYINECTKKVCILEFTDEIDIDIEL